MESLSEKKICLRAVEMFDGASDGVLEKLAEMATSVSFSRGENLIVEGERCGSLFFSVTGELAIFVKDGDAERQVAELSGGGKVVGEIGAVSGLKATATVRVISERATFLSIDGAEFQSVIGADPELASTVLRSLAKYLSNH